MVPIIIIIIIIIIPLEEIPKVLSIWSQVAFWKRVCYWVFCHRKKNWLDDEGSSGCLWV